MTVFPIPSQAWFGRSENLPSFVAGHRRTGKGGTEKGGRNRFHGPQLSRLTAQHPEGFSSQRQALKALAAIVQTDERDPGAASSAARSQSAVAGSG